MKNTLILLFPLFVLNACASKKVSPYVQDIQSTIKDHRKDVESCYDSYLKVKPNAQGKMMLKWTIRSDGFAKNIQVANNTFGDETVFSCMANGIKTWKFPTPPKDQEADVSYPFLFNVHKE
jgi:hypothetical protein